MGCGPFDRFQQIFGNFQQLSVNQQVCDKDGLANDEKPNAVSSTKYLHMCSMAGARTSHCDWNRFSGATSNYTGGPD